MASEQGLSVDEAGFRTLMQEQKARAKADAKAKKGGGVNTEVYRELRALGETPFTGFDTLAPAARCAASWSTASSSRARPGDVVEVVLDETPSTPSPAARTPTRPDLTGEVELEVLDVQRPVKGLVVHKATVASGELRTGHALVAQVDGDWRLGACQAHSATHVMHAALRQVLGPTALQAGRTTSPATCASTSPGGQGVSEDQREPRSRRRRTGRSAPTST